MLSAIRCARGVVTNAGSSLCHAAITCNELKKPCIVGTRFATEQLIDGEKIQINGKTGDIYSIASLDIVDLHPEADEFLDEKEQRLKQFWQEQKVLREQGAVIINKKEKKQTKTPEYIAYNVPAQESPQKKSVVDKDGNLNIKDLPKIDITKVKQIIIPIDQLFNSNEMEKLSNEYPGSVCMVAKEKIKRVLKDIKDI